MSKHKITRETLRSLKYYGLSEYDVFAHPDLMSSYDRLIESLNDLNDFLGE